jgi:hypothetical protein
MAKRTGDDRSAGDQLYILRSEGSATTFALDCVHLHISGKLDIHCDIRIRGFSRLPGGEKDDYQTYTNEYQADWKPTA